MLKYLPGNISDYLKEYIKFLFIGAPVMFFTIGRRLLILTNYETSFTLNLRLILIPLYGDFTIVGRCIGFVFRVLSIIYGFFALLLVFILTALSPVLWFVLNLVFIYELALFTPILYSAMFAVWFFIVKDKPFKDGAYRPRFLEAYNEIKISKGPAFKKFLEGPFCAELLSKLELDDTDFVVNLCGLYPSELIGDSLKIWEQSIEDYRTSFNHLFGEPEHLFLVAVATLTNRERFLSKYSLTLDVVSGAVRWLVDLRDEREKAHVWQKYYTIPPMGGIGKGLTGRVTPSLDQISTDFTGLVKKRLVPKTYWRMDEINKVADLLGGSNTNVLLVGPPGCGKTSIVLGMAKTVVSGTKYNQLKFKRIVSLETGRLLAGTRTSGDVAEKLKRAMQDVVDSGDIIVFIDEIHNLISGSSVEDAQSNVAYSILESYLSSHQVQFIGATNVENYRKYIEPNGAFSRLFQLVEIPPSSPEETIQILKPKAENLQKQYKVKISFVALLKIVEYSNKLIQDRVFPDKAIDILNRATASAGKYGGKVETEAVLTVISEVSKVPVTAVNQEESQKLLNIESEMKKRVIGQDQAIDMIGSALRRARAGIRNESKPIASFLFVGTTGVGKTETAKALARTFFGDQKRMIRLDMSEYQQKDSISRLLGSPDGSSKGVLTEAVRSAPYSLILLDEIEKAHPDILLTFLQVLDDGRLTDSGGRTVDFSNTIIISTSNAGTKSIQEVFEHGGSFDEIKNVAMREVKNSFAPEFLNRYTGIIVFKPLDTATVRVVADLLLSRVRELAESKGIKIGFTPELIDELVRRGYSPQWGARPLARTIEDTVESYLATKILEKSLGSGDEVVLSMEVFKDRVSSIGGGGIQ